MKEEKEWKQKLYDRIDSFEKLEENWDGYGGYPLSARVLKRARKFVKNLDYPLQVFPTGRNSVQFETERDNGNYIEFELFGDRMTLFMHHDDLENEVYEKAFPRKMVNKMLESYNFIEQEL